MLKLFVFAVLVALGWAGYRRYTKGAFILTDSKVENVAKLRTLAAAVNRDVPKELDAETTLLRVDVTNLGVVNRYKTTVAAPSMLFNGDRQNPVMQALRKQTCSNRAYKMAMAKGFSISYSYVDGNDVSLGAFTFRSADCIGV